MESLQKMLAQAQEEKNYLAITKIEKEIKTLSNQIKAEQVSSQMKLYCRNF